MSPEKLAEIRTRLSGTTPLMSGAYAMDLLAIADDLLAHVDHLTAENVRLREGIAELVSVGYSHTPDCEANEWQRVAYGGHPDCGLCWEDKLATLLNPPTEGEANE